MEVFLKIVEILGTFGGLWLIWDQLKLSRKDYEARFTYQKREKAIELAKEFEIFVKESLVIFELISKTKIVSYMQELKLEVGEKCLKSFDLNELRNLFKDYEENKNKYNIQLNIDKLDAADIYMVMKDCYDENKYTQEKLEYFYSNNFKMYDVKTEILMISDNETKKERLQYNTDLPFFMGSMFNDIYSTFTNNLNKLESMSMNFIADIADDNIVYNSLHQVFLSYVELCYFHIAEMNSKGAKDKYYTNTIELYKRWKKRYLEDVKKEKQIKENINKSQQEINEVDLNHPKIN